MIKLRIKLRNVLILTGGFIALVILAGLVDYFLENYIFGWEPDPNSKLHEAIEASDKIVIKTTGRHETSDPATKIKEVGNITNPVEIKEFILHLKVKANRLGSQREHLCLGDYDFIFYKGDKILTKVNIGHGHEIRWTDGWESDHSATEDSIKYLQDKFQKMGLKLDPYEYKNKNEPEAE